MAREPILNNNKTRLRLFEAGIKMDESLPKHKEYKEFKEKEKLLKEAEKLGDKLDMAKADIDLLRMEVQANVSNVNNNSILVSGSTGFDDMVFPKKGIYFASVNIPSQFAMCIKSLSINKSSSNGL